MNSARVAVASGVVLAAALAAPAAQQPPEQSLAGLRPGPGLEVTLWASEPMFSNPTNIAVDERGRLWVLEGVNYRRLQRNQPDIRPAGDRILILEDTNHDGRADTTKVFDQGPHLRVPLGIAVLGDRVYVSQSPDLVVYTKDAEDRIVSRDVLLTGFGGVDHDHGLHAVVFGPDGKLYFNHGNKGFHVTDRSGRTLQGSSYQGPNDWDGLENLNRPDAGFFQGVALRVNADGTDLEVLGHNFRNPFEIAVDSFGNVLQTDNDDDGNAWTRLAYVMEGGNYGYYGPLHRSWGADRGSHFHNELPGVVPNVLRLGAGSPCGLLAYEGTLLPERYRGQWLHAEAGRRLVAGYALAEDGAGFTAQVEHVVYGGPDTWFRPSDVAVAPDGSVFVADWYDPGVGGHAMGDPEGGQGRIYRIAPPNHRPEVPALDLQTDAGLTAALASPNQTVRYLAHAAIQARGAASISMLQRSWHGDDPILRARALWLLSGLGDTGSAAVQEALRDRDPRFRVLGLRVARHAGADVLALVQPPRDPAAQPPPPLLRDPSPHVRREIAIMLRNPDPAVMAPPYLAKPQTTPPGVWLDAMLTLLEQHDGQDRWYVEALAIAARGREDALYARLRGPIAAVQSPAAVAHLVWAMRPKSAIPDLVATLNDPARSIEERQMAIDTLGAMEWPEAARALEAFLLAESTPPALLARGFDAFSRQLFSLWEDARTEPAFPRVMRRALSMPVSQSAAVALAHALGDVRFLPDLVSLATSSSATEAARAAAIDSVATTGDARYLDDWRALAANGPTVVRAAAVRAAAALPQDDLESWAGRIVVSDAPNEIRVEALRAMGRTAAGLNAILDLAEAGRLPAELASLASILTNAGGQTGRGGRGRGGFAPPGARGRGAAGPAGAGGARGGGGPDPAMAAVRARAASVLPLPTRAAGPLPGIQQLERNYTGDVAAGRRIFEVDAGCAACHGVGGAPKAGPDLSAIGAKYGKQAMLDHIVRPSDAVAHEYVSSVFELANGAIVTGVVKEDTPTRLVVITANGEEARLNPADVRSRQQSRTSLMPEGLLDALSLQQIADLLQFLSTLDGAP
jgi:putative membrane-bound dehydrogenase-like protein